MAVIVVTDSSSCLQAEDRQRCGIRQAPLHVLLDGKDFRDGVDDVPADVHLRHATTAGATPAELADAYREALKAERRRWGGGRAHIGRAVEYLQFGGVGGTRVRSLGAHRQFQVGRDGRRVRRLGCRAGGRVRR